MSNKRIKLAMIATNLKLNGISTVIMNYISYLDLDKYRVTLIVGKGVAQKYRNICKRKKVQIIELAPRKESPVRFYYGLYKYLLFHHFDIVHVHGSNASIGMELFLAKISGIKIRIAHSHNTTSTSMRIHKMMKPIFNFSYTDGFACGKLAGKWLFGDKPFTIIPNGVEVDRFKFDPVKRNFIRKELKLDKSFVIGHVGRFNYQKNHKFLLAVFEEILKQKKNAKLLLVGNGPDFEKFRNSIIYKKFSKNIILYGETNKPNDLYQAMDYFVFPSRFEGLPLTLIEAQISGLPCLVSDVITPEVQLSKNLKFMSLNNAPKKWTKTIMNSSLEDRNNFFKENISAIDHYRIKNDVDILDKQYQKILKENNK
ncbi:glycosyltransferase family 1 protein [Lactobacillus sp. PV034]|uniref:glycosyltransferase family 1 protein n=1 Tax=Lactobacillus sp. PV034 TaxID=2594495 RepID=UPI00224042F8|nr:glycosyltransferase family 1 protein [Lactobacillus sp. PV034]QNQ80529.1 glycosyltransferase family 1 protein [Lactobacillus sp. PV034]